MGLPVRSVSYEEAEAKWGHFLTAFVQFENRASNRKAREELGWQPKGLDMLSDIRSGSYRDMVEKLRAGVPARTMLTASAMAVARSSDLPPGHHGGPLHPLAGLYAVAKLVGEYRRVEIQDAHRASLSILCGAR